LRGRRRWVVAVVAAVVALGVLWAPSLVARHYAVGAASADILTRPDKGWQFLYHVMRLSRHAQLGSGSSAMDQADELWPGPPARAVSVRLVYLDGPLTVAVPPGGTRPAAGRRVARPRSELAWLVTGRVRRLVGGTLRIGPRQTIGLLDYRSGRVVWDIRPLPEAGR
jgi:hypothetical protein